MSSRAHAALGFSFVLAAAILEGGFGAAQDARPATYRETSRVSVVEVPVQVIGRDGKPVRGLKADDFELDEDGLRQTITDVEAIELHRNIPVLGAPDLPSAARRHFLFLFDFTFATSNEIARSREAAMRFIEGGMSPDDLAGVATVSAERGLTLDLTFTSDRRQILSALRAVGLPTNADRSRDPLAFAFSAPGDPRLVIQETFSSKPVIQDADSTQKVIAAAGQRVSDDYMLSRVARHLSDMSALARALDLVDGRKTVLYFSEGFDSRLIFGSIANGKSAEQIASDNDAMLSGASWTIDVDRRYTNSPMRKQLQDTAELLRRSDCVVYPIDVAGIRGSGDGTIEPGRRGEDFLFALADGTDGELIENGNDFSKQIARVQEKTSLTYVLTYTAQSRGDGKFHALRVWTRIRGARVSARAGYYDRPAFGAQTPLQRQMSATNVITHAKEGGDFGLDVLAFAASAGRISQVPLVIGIPDGALAGRDAAGRVRLEIFAYAFDASGQVVDYFTRASTIDPRAAAGSRVLFYGTCRLLPGHYRIRVYVRNGVDGRFGFHAVDVEVPDPADATMHAVTPLFLSAGEKGLFLRDASRGPEEADPFSMGSTKFVPQVAPVLASGASAQVCLMLFRPGGGSAADAFQVDVQIVDGGGEIHAPSEMHLLGRTEPTSDGLVKVLLQFSASGLVSGPYSLRVTFRDSRDQALRAQAETAFRIS